MSKIFAKKNDDIMTFFVGKVLLGFIGLLTVSLYTYKLAPEDYGNYSLISGMVGILVAFFLGWVHSSASRYYDQYKTENIRFFSNVLLQWIAMTIIMISLMFIIVRETNFINSNSIEIYIVLIIIILGFYETFEGVLRAAKFTTAYIWGNSARSAANVAVFYILVTQFGLGVNSLFIATIISYAIVAGIVVVKFKLHKSIDTSMISVEMQKKFFRYGWPMVGVWGIGWMLNFSDRYIIRIFETSSKVGVYDIAYSFTESSINIIVTSFTMAIYPSLIIAWNEKGKNEAERILAKGIENYLLLIIPATVGLIAIRTFIFGTILSADYSQGAEVILYVSLGFLFNGLSQLIYKLWQLKEKTDKIFFLTCITVVVNVVLNFIFIPLYGFISAAITTLVAYLISVILALFSIRKEFSLQISKRRILKSCISSACMFIAINFVGNHYEVSSIISLFIIIILGAFIYVLFLFLSGASFKEELDSFTEKYRALKRIRK